MKGFRWSAVLVALVLTLSWAGAAQAQTANAPTDESSTKPSTASAAPSAPETPPPGDGQEQFCDPVVGEGLVSHSKISTETASAHPSASASFEVKEGCRVLVFLVSIDENGEPVDIDPPVESKDPTSGPGEHNLKVDLPSCSHFFVLFAGIKPEKGQQPSPQQLEQAQTATAEAMSSGDAPPDPDVVTLDETEGDTTKCPTTTTAPRAVPPPPPPPTTVAAAKPEAELPGTGSNSTLPMLIAGLVLLAGGGAALLATRLRGRHAGK